MDTELYLTIAAIVAILWGLELLSDPSRIGRNLRCAAGAAQYRDRPVPRVGAPGFGCNKWFARDFRDWAAVRSVLIGFVVGVVLVTLVNIWATIQGLFNALAWGSTIVNVLLLLGALYFLFTGSRKAA